MKKIKLSGLFIMAACILVCLGCGSNAGNGKGTGSDTHNSSNGKEKLKVALCVTGPINDGGWCTTAYNGLMKASELYDIETSYIENIAVVDMESAFTDYASQGYDLVIGHGFQFGDPALNVGANYPDTNFAIIEGSVSSDNVASYNLKTQENGYLEGVLAAHLTETGKVGMVSGVEGPSLIKIVEAFKLGAKSVSPDIEVMQAYTGSFSDVTKAKEAAMAMIDDGADVIAHCANQGGTGAIKAAEERGVLAMGSTTDQNALAPDTVVTSGLSDISSLLVEAIRSIVEGEFDGGLYELGYADVEGISGLAPYYGFEDKIPEDVKEEIKNLQQKIISGEFQVPKVEQITQ